MLELAEKDNQTVAITIFHTFRKLRHENIKKAWIKFLKMKTRMSEMKT